MKVLKNTKLQYIPPISMPIDDLSDLPYIPAAPLPAKSFALYIVGQPGSGKTSLWNSLLLSHPTKKNKSIPRMYYRFFDHVWLISPSMNTLPLSKLKLKDERMFMKYNDEILDEILEEEREGENLNNVIILDDCIRDLSKSKNLCRTILNRRHQTQNNDEEGQAGLSIIITSQKYNGLPLYLRANLSHIMVFQTKNKKELDALKDEVMADLTPEEQDDVLALAWKDRYGFLFIDLNKKKEDRYYQNFNKIVFENDSTEDDDDDDDY
jgi:GTPase SAR1 family protein